MPLPIYETRRRKKRLITIPPKFFNSIGLNLLWFVCFFLLLVAFFRWRIFNYRKFICKQISYKTKVTFLSDCFFSCRFNFSFRFAIECILKVASSIVIAGMQCWQSCASGFDDFYIIVVGFVSYSPLSCR